MAISFIEIEGYRSIDFIKINVRRIVAFIGQNGSGKSNILSALHYFYRNLTEEWEEEGIFDTNNLFRNEIRIRVEYDLTEILKYVQHNQKSGSDEYNKYYNKIKGISKNDKIILELLKRKGRHTDWNADYNARQIIASLFPLYLVDARKIQLTDWSDIWELIGDLIKLRYEDSDDIQWEIEKIVKKDSNLANKIIRLRGILKNRGINVKKLTSRQLGKIIAEIMVGGQVFQYDNRNLHEYSNGTNAFNYTLFLIQILSLMKQYKLKEPIIVLDEPEISLHFGMIDQLMENIFEEAAEIQFLLSTHSSRSVKDLLEREEQDYDIYHTVLHEKYTQIRKVRNLQTEDNRERIIITEAYTNSCFAKMILNVEGDTELEVLKNKYLKEIFPGLKYVEIVKGMSNRTVHNLTSPSKRNYQTPGLALIDMDKLLVKREGINKLSFSGLNENYALNENYHYGKKRRNTLYLHKRITSMCEKCNFYFKYPFYSCDDFNYKHLLDLIAKYCDNYRIFVWKNTIEGALITDDNLYLFLEYMCTALSGEQMKKVSQFTNKFAGNIRLNYLRLVFSGKSDYLLTKKQIKKENNKIDEEILHTIGIVKKTSGWVSGWLEFYFLKKAGISQDAAAPFKEFRKFLSNEENSRMIRQSMQNDFSDLFHLMAVIEKEMTR